MDASAILAILFRETEKNRFREIIARTTDPVMSPFNFLEAAVRADGLKIGEPFDLLMKESGITIVETNVQQANLARQAYRRFGKGNHPARLNMGDCFAYALSKARNEPLLFKGNDFPQTDIESAL